MTRAGLGFVTHFQIERLLGGDRAAQQQRRRLTARGLLPEPEWLRVDRTRLAIFPAFSLSALLGASPARAAALEHSARSGLALYNSHAFELLREPLQEAMRLESAMRSSAELGSFLLREAHEALNAWCDAVAEAEAELHAAGSLRAYAGIVRVHGRDNGYLVIDEAGDETEIPLAAAADDLSGATHGSLERVGLLDVQRLFLLGVPEQLADADGELISALSSMTADGPARLPAADAAGEDGDEPEPLVGRRRRTVWRQGNTMTRAGAER